jgi:hypothetical protein
VRTVTQEQVEPWTSNRSVRSRPRRFRPTWPALASGASGTSFGLTPEHRPAALSLGRAVHSAIEALHLAKLEGETIETAKLVRTFRADWQAELDTGLSFKSDESPGMLRWQGEHLVAEYARWLADRKVVAAEMPFEIDLIDPETGEVSDERLRGYFDVILEGDVIGEVKTAARRFDEGTLSRKLQFSAYAYAWRQLRDRDPTVLVVSLLKNKKPEVVEAVAKPHTSRTTPSSSSSRSRSPMRSTSARSLRTPRSCAVTASTPRRAASSAATVGS